MYALLLTLALGQAIVTSGATRSWTPDGSISAVFPIGASRMLSQQDPFGHHTEITESRFTRTWGLTVGFVETDKTSQPELESLLQSALPSGVKLGSGAGSPKKLAGLDAVEFKLEAIRPKGQWGVIRTALVGKRMYFARALAYYFDSSVAETFFNSVSLELKEPREGFNVPSDTAKQVLLLPRTIAGGLKVRMPIGIEIQPSGQTVEGTWRVLEESGPTFSVKVSRETEKPNGLRQVEMLRDWLESKDFVVTGHADRVVNGWPQLEVSYQSALEEGVARVCSTQQGNYLIAVERRKGAPAPLNQDEYLASFELPAEDGKGPLVRASGLEERTAALYSIKAPLEWIASADSGPNHRASIHTGSFGARSYWLFELSPILDEWEVPSTKDEQVALLQSILSGSEDLARHDIKVADAEVAGQKGVRGSFLLANGFECRVEMAYERDRIFILLATYPSVVAKSAEIEEFFGSFRFRE